jgi:hypothetical protein
MATNQPTNQPTNGFKSCDKCTSSCAYKCLEDSENRVEDFVSKRTQTALDILETNPELADAIIDKSYKNAECARETLKKNFGL